MSHSNQHLTNQSTTVKCSWSKLRCVIKGHQHQRYLHPPEQSLQLTMNVRTRVISLGNLPLLHLRDFVWPFSPRIHLQEQQNEPLLPILARSKQASHTAVLHELTNIHSLDPFQIHHHDVHISIYFNLPKFQNGSIRKRLKFIRETRRTRCNSDHILTITSSLAPQHDTTEEWDGGLLKVLP